MNKEESSEPLTIGLSSYINVKDVRINWLTYSSNRDIPEVTLTYPYSRPDLDMIRMEVISHKSGFQKCEEDSVMITEDDLSELTGKYPKLLEELEILRYRELLIYNALIVDTQIGSIEKWVPFFERHSGHRLREGKKTHESEYNRIRQVCSAYPTLHSLYNPSESASNLSARIGEALLNALKDEDPNMEHLADVLLTGETVRMIINSVAASKLNYFKDIMSSMQVTGSIRDHRIKIMSILIAKIFPSFSSDGAKVYINPSNIYKQVLDCMKADFPECKTINVH